MKRGDTEAIRLLRQLGRLAVPVASAEREGVRSERIADSLDRLLDRLPAERERRRRRTWVAGGLAAAAAAALVSFAAGRLLGRVQPAVETSPYLQAVDGHVGVWHRGRVEVEVARPGLVLKADDELRVAPTARAELVLADQATVNVDGKTTLAVNAGFGAEGEVKDERIELEEGRVTLRVPKLPAGHTLRVHTPDALVTVRGTRFSVGVEPRPLGGTVTRVTVAEGRVEVAGASHTLLLGPGEEWTSAEAETAIRPNQEPPPATTPLGGSAEGSTQDPGSSRSGPGRARATGAEKPAAAPRSPMAVVESPTAPTAGAETATPASTLAEETRGYERAMRLARSGELDQASAELATLIREHPRSPLIQSARVERFRLLYRLGNHAQAASEARRYLSDYPSGFARAEAKQIALFGMTESP